MAPAHSPGARPVKSKNARADAPQDRFAKRGGGRGAMQKILG